MKTCEQSRTKRSQYQHYVPQLLLRKWSDFVRPVRSEYVDERHFEKALSKAKSRARVNVLLFKDDFSRDELCSRFCKKTFGLPGMYDARIEDELSGLEQRVSKVIDAIE